MWCHARRESDTVAALCSAQLLPQLCITSQLLAFVIWVWYNFTFYPLCTIYHFTCNESVKVYPPWKCKICLMIMESRLKIYIQVNIEGFLSTCNRLSDLVRRKLIQGLQFNMLFQRIIKQTITCSWACDCFIREFTPTYFKLPGFIYCWWPLIECKVQPRLTETPN